MSKKRPPALRISIFLSLVICIIPSLSTANTLNGKRITTAFYFPNQGTIGFGGVPIDTIVGPSIEISGSPQEFQVASIDFSETTIELRFFQNLTGSISTFNGWRFYDAADTIPAFKKVVLTTLNTTGWIVSFDENNIWVNGSGVRYSTKSVVRIDISF